MYVLLKLQNISFADKDNKSTVQHLTTNFRCTGVVTKLVNSEMQKVATLLKTQAASATVRFQEIFCSEQQEKKQFYLTVSLQVCKCYCPS